jgi:hypothetical protein
MALLEPAYTSLESVKVRLRSKVQFQECDALKPGELSNDFLRQLICDAETEVEQDMRGRYSIPFRSKRAGTYLALPDHSKRALRTLCDMKAVELILETDFGRGTHIAGSNYAEKTESRYDLYVKKLLGIQKNPDGSEVMKRTPPLEDLLLNPSNAAADDGFRGMIINTDQSNHDAVSYAEESLNNPSRSWPGFDRGRLP